MKIKGKNVLVIGSGLSGIGAVKLLHKVGAIPILLDGNTLLKVSDIQNKLPKDLYCEIILGLLSKEKRKEIQLVILSPGVPIDSKLVKELKEDGIPIWGEIELAYQMGQGRVLGITGTNGKTTTTALVGEIMKDFYPHVYVVGNIGNPYTNVAYTMEEDAVTVAEISSFQLETIDEFKPEVAAILNISPDHLDRHYTMENYRNVKKSITKNQTNSNVCVLNYDDESLRAFGKNMIPRVVYFSLTHKLEEGIYLDNDKLILAKENVCQSLMNIDEMKLLGNHNIENVMAALGIAINMGVSIKSAIDTVKKFPGVEHRIEFVATKNGVDYYNDSKGTNPDAAIKAIQAMRKPTLLIGGGYDKEGEYDQWVESFREKVKVLVLIGQTKDKIEACSKKCGYHEIIKAETLEEAMKICIDLAVEGDAVLLSPACASWGMFSNYEERGSCFKKIVNSLKG